MPANYPFHHQQLRAALQAYYRDTEEPILCSCAGDGEYLVTNSLGRLPTWMLAGLAHLTLEWLAERGCIPDPEVPIAAVIDEDREAEWLKRVC